MLPTAWPDKSLFSGTCVAFSSLGEVFFMKIEWINESKFLLTHIVVFKEEVSGAFKKVTLMTSILSGKSD